MQLCHCLDLFGLQGHFSESGVKSSLKLASRDFFACEFPKAHLTHSFRCATPSFLLLPPPSRLHSVWLESYHWWNLPSSGKRPQMDFTSVSVCKRFFASLPWIFCRFPQNRFCHEIASFMEIQFLSSDFWSWKRPEARHPFTESELWTNGLGMYWIGENEFCKHLFGWRKWGTFRDGPEQRPHFTAVGDELITLY